VRLVVGVIGVAYLALPVLRQHPLGRRDPQVLAPGATRSFSVTWSGLSSQPRCVGQRTRVGPGTYQLVARVGTLVSRRAALVLR